MDVIETLEHGYKVIALAWGEESPLENHAAFEVGVDVENRAFYVSEGMLRTYGTTSVFNACRGYVNKRIVT
jgi:hypothetical protein